MRDICYYKDLTNNRILKLDYKESKYYYLDSDQQWVQDRMIIRQVVGTYGHILVGRIEDFEDVYPIKEIPPKYAYYKTEDGFILKIDEYHEMCYCLGMDMMWHKDLTIYHEYQHGEFYTADISFEDKYPTGEEFVYPLQIVGTYNPILAKRMEDSEGIYPVKEIPPEYTYYKTGFGFILKIDEHHGMCYQLGVDLMWHKNLTIYDQYLRGEVYADDISFEDKYPTGEEFVYPLIYRG